MKRFTVLILVAALLIAISAESLYSIPAFARKYKMSCQTCHLPFPKLKKYGDDFAGNGFVLNDQDASRAFLETGDKELTLLRDFPIAARLEGHVSYNNANEKQSDLGTPYSLKLLSGGSIAKDIAYYFYFYMSEQGSITGIEDAFIMFNDLFGIDLDLYVGQFQVCDPMFKRELRLTLEDYELYRRKPGLSKSGLTYDRGIMMTYNFSSGTSLTFEVVNGAGLTVAEESKLFDTDNYKNFVWRASQEVGDFLRIGGFIYSGNELLSNVLGIEETNKIQIYGVDITLNYSDILELNLQSLNRKDNNIFLYANDMTPQKEIKTKGILGELIFTPDGDKSKWYLTGIFNLVDSDVDELDYKAGGLHIGYLLNRNIRLVGEGLYDFSKKDSEFMKGSIGIVTAF